MTLIKGDKTIAYAKRSRSFFTLDLAIPGQTISAISKAMAIMGWG